MNGSEAKKSFVIREIPTETFLDSRLRNNAHQLLGLLWSKADAKTGELRIGSHWFEQHELVRMARKLGISESTFRRVLRDQLIPCGYVKEIARGLVPHTDASGRLRKVFGPQHYIVFKTSQEPHGQRKIREAKPKKPPTEQVSTSGQIWPLEENARPLDDSTSGQNHEKPENGSTSGQSTSVVERPDSTSKESPTSSAMSGGGGGGHEFFSARVCLSSFQKSTTAKPENSKPQNSPPYSPPSGGTQSQSKDETVSYVMRMRAMELSFWYPDHLFPEVSENLLYKVFVTNGVEQRSCGVDEAIRKAIEARHNGGDFAATFAVHWQKHLKQREHNNELARERGARLRQEAERKRARGRKY